MAKQLIPKKDLEPHIIYLLCCIAGVVICYALYKAVPNYPFYWAIVSVALALSPDNSTKQGFSRIKANVLGCAVGLCLYPLHFPELPVLCLGVSIIIGAGFLFRITDTLRSALAAFIIVTIQVEKVKHWYIPLERVVCVVTGCVVALLLTLLFNFLNTLFDSKRAT